MKKLVEITTCTKCPRNYFNTMPSGEMKDGRPWCALSNCQLDANKMFTEIPEWCQLPNSENGLTISANVVHDPNSRPIHLATGGPVVYNVDAYSPTVNWIKP